MDGVVPPFVTPDRIWHARIALNRRQRVVPPLALGLADRVDRREVEDIESHLRNSRQLALNVTECRALAGRRPRRAREHRVPRRESRLNPIDGDRELDRVGESLARAGSVHRLQHLRLLQASICRRLFRLRHGPFDRSLNHRCVRAGCPRQQLLVQVNALHQLAGHVHGRREFLDHLVTPRPDVVGKRLDPEVIGRILIDRERCPPAIVVDEPHLCFAPRVLVRGSILDNRGQQVMALPKDVGGHLYAVAHFALDRIATAVYLGLHIFDQDAARRHVAGFHVPILPPPIVWTKRRTVRSNHQRDGTTHGPGADKQAVPAMPRPLARRMVNCYAHEPLQGCRFVRPS